MANELLKTLTIDGKSVDILELIGGSYIKFEDSETDNKQSISQIWTAVSANKTITIVNNTLTNEPIYTAPENGLYVCYYMAQFAANTSGARYVAPAKISNSSTELMGGHQRVGAAASGQTFISGFSCNWLYKGDKIGMRVFQNSGSNLSTNLLIGGQYLSIVNWDNN